ncbi:MAG: AsmA-like C-terminal region-containing protein [Rubripirellula sp.]
MMFPIRLPLQSLGWALVICLPVCSFAQDAVPETHLPNQQRASEPQADGRPAPAKTRYWKTKWSFQDVDVQRLLSRLESIGIEIPVDAAGKVSVELNVSIPLNRLGEGRAYRLIGTIKSEKLRLENLLLTDFTAELKYDDGVLNLTTLKAGWAEALSADEVADQALTRQASDLGSLPSGSKAAAGSRGGLSQTEGRESQAKRAGGSGTLSGEAGTLSGEARMELLPRGELSAKLDVKDLPLESLQRLLTGTANPDQVTTKKTGSPRRTPLTRGRLSGRIEATAAVDQLSELKEWSADGQLDMVDVRIGDATPITIRSGPIKLRDGVMLADSIQLTSSSSKAVQLGLACELELTDAQRFQFRLVADDLPLDVLSEAITSDDNLLTGKLDLNLHGQGELAAGRWELKGQIGSPQLSLMGQSLGVVEHDLQFDSRHFELVPVDNANETLPEGMTIGRVSADYVLQSDAFRMSSLTANLFGGRIQGSLTLARNPTQQHAVKFSWVDLAPRLHRPGIGKASMQLRFRTSGDVDWSVPFNALQKPADHRGTVHVRVEPVEIDAANVGQVELVAYATNGIIEVDGSGRLFGGSLSMDLTSRASRQDTWGTLLNRDPEGHARVDRIRLDQMTRVLAPRYQRRVRGTLDLRLNYHVESETRSSVPACRIVARDVALDGRTLTRQLDLTAMFRGDRLVVEQIRGSFAGGQLWADGDWTLGKGVRRLHVRVSGVDVSDALFPIAKSMSPNLVGVASGSATVTDGQGIRFRGAITARDSEVFGIPTGTLRSGISGTISKDLRHWSARFPSIQGEMAKGQLGGELILSSSSSRSKAFDMSSRWNVRRIDFGQLLTSSEVSSRIAHGRVSGELTLGGRGIRSLQDLNGRFDAKLGTTQAAAIPGLVQADQFLGLITLSGSQFKEGRAKGVVGAGQATIDQFELSSDRTKVWSQGKIRLDNLRMDMEVIISTGNFRLGDQQLVAFAGQLAMQSVFPLTTLVEVNRILRDRTIYLDVSGSLADPRLRLKPLEIIREEALQFLIRELLVAASVRKN